jgi:hypothetical protein
MPLAPYHRASGDDAADDFLERAFAEFSAGDKACAESEQDVTNQALDLVAIHGGLLVTNEITFFRLVGQAQ